MWKDNLFEALVTDLRCLADARALVISGKETKEASISRLALALASTGRFPHAEDCYKNRFNFFALQPSSANSLFAEQSWKRQGAHKLLPTPSKGG